MSDLIESNEVYISALSHCLKKKDIQKAVKVLEGFEKYLKRKDVSVNVPIETIDIKEKIQKPKITSNRQSRGNLGAEYIPNWKSIRAAIVKRDDGCCRICNKNYYLHVHHIDWDRSNNKDSNLVTLCEPCHRAVHKEGYKPWNDDYPAPWNKQEIDVYNQDNNW